MAVEQAHPVHMPPLNPDERRLKNTEIALFYPR
jgi:hypothetical protein